MPTCLDEIHGTARHSQHGQRGAKYQRLSVFHHNCVSAEFKGGMCKGMSFCSAWWLDAVVSFVETIIQHEINMPEVKGLCFDPEPGVSFLFASQCPGKKPVLLDLSIFHDDGSALVLLDVPGRQQKQPGEDPVVGWPTCCLWKSRRWNGCGAAGGGETHSDPQKKDLYAWLQMACLADIFGIVFCDPHSIYIRPSFWSAARSMGSHRSRLSDPKVVLHPRRLRSRRAEWMGCS